MHRNEAGKGGGRGGRGRGAVTNDILKFKKLIEFQSSHIVIFFSYIYLIIDGKNPLSIKNVVKDL